jgi:hypothetical protein
VVAFSALRFKGKCIRMATQESLGATHYCNDGKEKEMKP